MASAVTVRLSITSGNVFPGLCPVQNIYGIRQGGGTHSSYSPLASAGLRYWPHHGTLAFCPPNQGWISSMKRVLTSLETTSRQRLEPFFEFPFVFGPALGLPLFPGINLLAFERIGESPLQYAGQCLLQ
jgi:hypothetical protein